MPVLHFIYFSLVIRKNAMWTLSLNDTIVKTEAVVNKTDVNLFGRYAFLGGRPGIKLNSFGTARKEKNISRIKIYLYQGFMVHYMNTRPIL